MPERLFSDSFYEIFSSNAMLRIARDRDNNNLLVEGVIDLAFEQVEVWTVVDFKTDEEFRGNEPAYRRQVAMYAPATQAANGARVSALLMRV